MFNLFSYSRWLPFLSACDTANIGIIVGYLILGWLFTTVYLHLSRSTSADTRQLSYFVQMLTLFVALDIRSVVRSVFLLFSPDWGLTCFCSPAFSSFTAGWTS
jgi:hypothetical protein